MLYCTKNDCGGTYRSVSVFRFNIFMERTFECDCCGYQITITTRK